MISIEVPATSANLGAGFDCLGIALDLCNLIDVEYADSTSVAIVGQGEEFLHKDQSNLVLRSMSTVYEELGRSMPPLQLTLTNRIPLQRGLGSSAAAVVGGVVAANALNDYELDDDRLLTLAARIEGHPDNVAPALFGGLTVAVTDSGSTKCARLEVPPALSAVAFVPEKPMPTSEARRVLPQQVSLADAVFNVGRGALFIAALATERYDLLRTATQDRLHQSFRQAILPELGELVDAALDAGASAAFLSGAGSTVLALIVGSASDVAAAFGAISRTKLPGRVLPLAIRSDGVKVLHHRASSF